MIIVVFCTLVQRCKENGLTTTTTTAGTTTTTQGTTITQGTTTTIVTTTTGSGGTTTTATLTTMGLSTEKKGKLEIAGIAEELPYTGSFQTIGFIAGSASTLFGAALLAISSKFRKKQK